MIAKFTVAFCLWLVSWLSTAQSVPAYEVPLDQAQTIRAQVINPYCFFQSTSSVAYQRCTQASFRRTQALALYDETTQIVYFVVSAKPGGDPNRPLKYYMGKVVEVRGQVVKRAKAHGLIIQEVNGPYSNGLPDLWQ